MQMSSLSVLAASVAAMEAAYTWPDLVVTWTIALSLAVVTRCAAVCSTCPARPLC